MGASRPLDGDIRPGLALCGALCWRSPGQEAFLDTWTAPPPPSLADCYQGEMGGLSAPEVDLNLTNFLELEGGAHIM